MRNPKHDLRRRRLGPVATIAAMTAIGMAGSADAITRQDAIDTVTNTLILGSPHEAGLRGYALQSTVLPGTVLGESPADTLAIVGSESWFIWLDLAPPAGFGHPTKFVLVDDAGGIIVLDQDAEFWPYIDGISPYASTFDRVNSPDVFWDGGPVVSPRPAVERPARPDDLQGHLDPGYVPRTLLAGTWGMIVCPYDTSTHSDLGRAVRDLKAAFDSLGIASGTTVSMDSTPSGTLADLGSLPDSCSKLYVAWVGHGASNDSLCTGDGGRIGHRDLACSLKAQAADEYCLIIDACYSGAILDDLAAKGVNGYHVFGCSDSSLVLRHNPAPSRWRGDIGWWWSYHWSQCIQSGLRGATAYAWADSAVCAYKDSIAANGSTAADSTAWAPYAGDPDNAKPVGGYVHTFDEIGEGSAGVPYGFEVGKACSTTCITFPGSTNSDTCANFTLSCQSAVGTDTTWVKVGSYNWNKGRNVYFRTASSPDATGKYKIVSHSNKPAGTVVVTWLRDTSKPVTTPAPTFNAHSVGWYDDSSAEFDQTLGQGTNGIHQYFWLDGAAYDQIPAFIGPNWFIQVQGVLPLVEDLDRPELYIANDPTLGYAESTVLVLFLADLRNPKGGPGLFTDVQVTVQQPNSGYFNQINFTVETPAPLGGAPIPPIPLDLGTIFPEATIVAIDVFGPDVLEIDSYALMPASAIDPTGVPNVALPDDRGRILASWPNPFRVESTVALSLDRQSHVGLRVYDVSGRLVRTLVSGPVGSGKHTFTWDGRTDGGGRVASGVYLYRLDVPGERQETRKVVFVR